MRKLKFFMMLALLVVGVSSVWGYNYTVNYVGRTTTQGAGYTVSSNYVTSGDNAATIVTSNNNTQFDTSWITPYTIEGYSVTVERTTNATRWSAGVVTITYTARYISYRVLYEKSVISGTGYTVNSSAAGIVTTGDDADVITFDTQASGAPTSVTTNTIGNYITARNVDGYDVSFYVNEAEAELGYKGNIYINYQTTATATTWNDGIFEYSTVYQRETYTQAEMPDGEVAVSLYMGDTETVTDTVSYTSRHGTGWQTDDDEDGVGTQAYFTSLGEHYDGINGEYRYFYLREHEVACSKQTSVTIPATIEHDGKTYKVTAIQKWGFGYKQTHSMMIPSCNSEIWGCIDDHSNRYLKEVRFEQPSNVKSIGDYAFMSSTALESIVFPNSLEYLGQGIFEMCTALNDCRFQTLDDGTVKFKIIKMFTFWLCTALQSIELPDGITEIEGQQAGAAMQYMLSLINVRLPNTLQHIGPHFLCCASSLETLTIPASVTYIDGAAFHGCESLKNVYLLGSAAALQAEYTGSGSETSSSTFSANSTFCKDAVSDCTFWVTDDYYDSYANDGVWSQIDETVFNEDFTEIVSQSGNRNALRKIIQEKRKFPAKWVTAIFPYGVTDYKTAFPAGTKETRVAVMDPNATHTATVGQDPKSGKSIRLYNVVYKLIEGDDIPAQTPVMICAGQETEYVMFTQKDSNTDWFKEEASKEHPTTVTAEDGAQIIMKGKYVPYMMHPWDFYFMYKDKTQNADGSWTYNDPDEKAKFYRVPDANNAATVGTCRCYWTINVENVKANTQMAPAQDAKGYNIFMDDDETTGIDDVEIRVSVDVYDLNGRKLDIAPADLPHGIYIVNGKKQLVK